ncbi:MAG: alpha/beta hydrolase [archaeon]
MIKNKVVSKKRKRLIIGSIAFGAILVIFLLVQFYLYFNFLLGNDVAVRVSVDKEFVSLKHWERGEITVVAKILTNPFCETRCEYQFLDVSKNSSVGEGEFIFKNSEPFSKTYSLLAPPKGTGEIIYRFEINCASSEGFLCYSRPEPFYQSTPVILGYGLTEEEEAIKNLTLEELGGLLDDLYEWEDYLWGLNAEINSSPLSVEGVHGMIARVKASKHDALDIKEFWEAGSYLTAGEVLEKKSGEFYNSSKEFAEFENKTNAEVARFNYLVGEFNSAQEEFSRVLYLNFSDDRISNARSSAEEFIVARDSFLDKGNLLSKEGPVNALEKELESISLSFEEDILEGLEQNNSLDVGFEVSVTSFVEVNKTDFEGIKFIELESQCCLFGECGSCCEDCNSDEGLYPIVFLHGHDFSSKVSAEYNLNIFEGMQRELERDGLFNAGTMLINVPEDVLEGSWRKVPWPVSVKSSYYFDSIRKEGELSILQTKKDNIDTYSIRLNSIVESVKKKTGKDKVVLVTHSMGGLVARRYIQIFGEDDVYKLIMVASPNQGISERVYSFCKAFGESQECDDMVKGSLLLSKLSNQEFGEIEVYNIVGVGCDTGGSDGDGVVKKENAVLGGAENYFVNGTCGGFDYLHSMIVDPNEYPETYDILKDILF